MDVFVTSLSKQMDPNFSLPIVTIMLTSQQDKQIFQVKAHVSGLVIRLENLMKVWQRSVVKQPDSST